MNIAMTWRKGRSDSKGKEALELVPVARRTPPPRSIRCAPTADAEKILLLAKSTFRPQTVAERIIADSFTGGKHMPRQGSAGATHRQNTIVGVRA